MSRWLLAPVIVVTLSVAACSASATQDTNAQNACAHHDKVKAVNWEPFGWESVVCLDGTAWETHQP